MLNNLTLLEWIHVAVDVLLGFALIYLYIRQRRINRIISTIYEHLPNREVNQDLIDIWKENLLKCEHNPSRRAEYIKRLMAAGQYDGD